MGCLLAFCGAARARHDCMLPQAALQHLLPVSRFLQLHACLIMSPNLAAGTATSPTTSSPPRGSRWATTRCRSPGRTASRRCDACGARFAAGWREWLLQAESSAPRRQRAASADGLRSPSGALLERQRARRTWRWLPFPVVQAHAPLTSVQVAPYELLDSLPRLSWEDARARQALRARLAAAGSGGGGDGEGQTAAQQILASAQAVQPQQS